MKLFIRDRAFYREFFALLLFIAVQNLVAYSVNLADSVMIGNYSEEALAGVSFANQIQFLLQMIVGSAGEGVVVLAAQYWGKRDTRPIGAIIGMGLLVSLSVGLMFMLAARFMPEWVLRLLTDKEGAIREGAAYMRVIAYSYVIFSVSTVLLAGLRSVQVVRIGLMVSLTALTVNVALNYLLIFGKFGFPRLGVVGAAIATLVARALELAIIIAYVALRDQRLRLKFRALLAIPRAIARDYGRVATPVILAGLSWGMAMFLQTAILGRMEIAVVTANAIAGALFSVIAVVMYGSANAAGVMTGKLVGAGDMDKVRAATVTMQWMFLVIGLFTGAAILACGDLVIAMYGVSAQANALARQFIAVLAVTSVGSAYQCPVLTGIVRGGGDTRFVLYNDLIFQWGVVLTSSYLAAFVFNMPPVVVFACLKSDQVLKCAVAYVKVNRYRWVRKLTRDQAGQEAPAAPCEIAQPIEAAAPR